MEKMNEKKDPLWVRIVAASICVLITIALELLFGSLLFMGCTIIFEKVCAFLGVAPVTSASVVAFLFGFFCGNAFFLPTLVIFKSGHWPKKVAKSQISENEKCKN